MGFFQAPRVRQRSYTCIENRGFRVDRRTPPFHARKQLPAVSEEREEDHQLDVRVDVHLGSAIPFGVLSKASFLLASVFGRVEDDDERAADGNKRRNELLTTQYQLRLMTSLQARALKEQDDFALFVARAGDENALAGVLTVSRGLSASGAREYDGGAVWGTNMTIYSVCNVAVKEGVRRRGIGTRLMRRAEEHVAGKSTEESVVVVLSVDKYNEEAKRLYEGLGFRIDEAWEDPRWLESVSRGAVDVARRVLLWKPLPRGRS